MVQIILENMLMLQMIGVLILKMVIFQNLKLVEKNVFILTVAKVHNFCSANL